MTQDTSSQHDQLYEIARRAQKKAIHKRQKRIKRAARLSRCEALANSNSQNDAPVCTRLAPLQRRGRHGEDRAALFLQSRGVTILERNIHCRTGEIDLVATDGTRLLFIEVRSRRSHRFGGAAASVTHAKQRRLIRTAQFFLPRLCARYFSGMTPPCRFDVITIDAQQLHWITHAFDHATP